MALVDIQQDLHDEIILDVLRQAKAAYMEHAKIFPEKGMCYFIVDILFKKTRFKASNHFLSNLIPEFNYDFCGGTSNWADFYWWDVSLKTPRIRAFDKLIKHYANKSNKNKRRNHQSTTV